jgi:hypothetical protein
MDALIIEQTEFAPKVVLDPVNNKFEISGESRPENAGKFYEPIVKWLEQYQAVLFYQKGQNGKANKVLFDFSLDYFNSTSAKHLLDILKQLDTYYNEGHEVLIRWFYISQDEDMRDSGEEFSKLISAPLEFIEREL